MVRFSWGFDCRFDLAGDAFYFLLFFPQINNDGRRIPQSRLPERDFAFGPLWESANWKGQLCGYCIRLSFFFWQICAEKRTPRSWAKNLCDDSWSFLADLLWTSGNLKLILNCVFATYITDVVTTWPVRGKKLSTCYILMFVSLLSA